MVLREPRPGLELNPDVDHGLIASADKLTKDAIVRDEFAAHRDILCFETEAAGLMNHFPCLVIRGIINYSDSHKNNTWEGYAAMVAAAYAKDLLLHQIAPQQVKRQELVTEILKVEEIHTRFRITFRDNNCDFQVSTINAAGGTINTEDQRV
jgi:hypothetical protein